MATIQTHLRLTTVRTPDGLVQFDPKGFATVSEAQAAFLLRLPGYVAAEAPEAPPAPAPAPAPAPELEPEPVASEPAPEAIAAAPEPTAAPAPAPAKKKPGRRRA